MIMQKADTYNVHAYNSTSAVGTADLLFIPMPFFIPRLKPGGTKPAMPTALGADAYMPTSTIPRLKPGVTTSVMPTALGATRHMPSPGAIGTAHFVTDEFIPLNYTAYLTSASAIGTTDLVTWEFIPVPPPASAIHTANLKTNERCKP